MQMKYILLDRLNDTVFLGAYNGETHFTDSSDFIVKNGVTRAVLFDTLKEAVIYGNEINMRQTHKSVVALPIQVQDDTQRHIWVGDLCKQGYAKECINLLSAVETINNTIH